jgi:hypothetical protein
MDSGWFYIHGANRHGPLSADALRAALVSMPDPRRVLVWGDGMPDWREAGQVADLARVLPPSPPVPPSAPLPSPVYRAPAEAAHPSAPHVFAPHPFPQPQPAAGPGLFAQAADPSVEAIVEGARRYRTLVLLVGAQILGALLMPFVIGLAALMPEQVFGFLALGFLVALAVLGIWTTVSVYRVADAIDAGSPVLWVVLQFIPFVNIISLLVLSSKAQTWCRHHGVAVGFFGPSEASLAGLRSQGF